MTTGAQTILIPVKDLDGAKKFYGQLLGEKPIVDQPYYVGFQVAGQDVGLNPNGHAQGWSGPLPFWHVDDIAKSMKALVSAGGTINEDAHDVGGGKLVASVTDSDGNLIGLIQLP
jgi:predicted enzyme related to lactoylglutathione lyase